jgi:uroporphyrinogen-III synthase
MSNESRRLFERHGANVLSAPALEEVPLANQQPTFEFGEFLMRDEVDVLVLLTGVGTRMLVDVLASRWERSLVLSKLERLQLVCRGPKPVGALKLMGLKPSFVVAEPNTWRDIVSAFDEHGFGQDKRVWVQEYGRPNPELVQALAGRAGSVQTVALYGWKLPDDCEPLKVALAAMVAGTVRIAAFTAGIQVDHLFEVAARLSLDRALLQVLKERIVIASVGPMTSERLNAHGIAVDIEPEHPKLGHLVQAVAANAKEVLIQKRRNLNQL